MLEGDAGEAAMTDQWDTGDEEAFGEDFFASLEAGPDPDTPGSDAAGSEDVFDGAAGPDEFQYESESDGSFETEAEDPADPVADPADTFPDDFDANAEDFPFDIGGEG